MRKKLTLFIISCGASLLLSVVAAEVLLRIWRPPYLLLQGTHILLSRNLTIENNYTFNSKKIRDHIIIKRNSLGFRGPEPPIDFGKHLTIVAVGGSTTECIFITEGKTWTDILFEKLKSRFPGIWINNAGIDGHSTFGHTELLKQYIGALKPTYVLFLVGINDMAIDQGRTQDKAPIAGESPPAPRVPWRWVEDHSALLAYIRFLQNKKGVHTLASSSNAIINYQVLGTSTDYNPVTEKDISRYNDLLAAYKTRLRSLIELTKSYSIKPILVTQPAVYGSGIDEETGVNLADIIVSDFPEPNVKKRGADEWQLLELYNNGTKEVAQELNVPVIDLAQEMPKNTKYYYDYVHFTEEGAQKVGEILANNLYKIL